MIEGFPFDEFDLATNRRGHLTDGQKEKVRVEYERRRRFVLLLLAIGPPVAIVLGMLAVAGGDGDGPSFGTVVVLVYAITVLLVAPMLGLAMYRTYLRPLRTGATSSFSGRIKLTPRGDDVHMQFGSRLRGPRFAIGPEQAEQLTSGDAYTVYYTPAGSRALFHSLERHFEPVANQGSEAPNDNSEGND